MSKNREATSERFHPGQVRSAGGESVFQLALEHSTEALDTVLGLMRTAGAEKTRLMAAMVVLDYARRAEPLDDDGVIDAPGELVNAPAKLAASSVDRETMREAKVKVVEALNKEPSRVYTAPVLAAETGVPVNIASAVLVQLHRDGHIQRGGPGMFQAKSH